MSVRNQNWYNLQANRSYPLDESSTGVDDAGAFLRNDILVDCNIRFPAAIGRYLYVQGVTVSAGIVTVLFGAVNDILATSGTPVAVVSLPKPINSYVNYAITALQPGVSGWVVFGPGLTETFAGRYTQPTQTLIQPRCAQPYKPLPVPSIGKLNVGTALQGVVTMAASTPVTATYEPIEYDGTVYPAIVFRLDSAQITTAYNPLTEFLGPCSQRPESGTCPKQPIMTLNGIEPDCNGNINIAFNFNQEQFTGGINLLTDATLTDLCTANQLKQPQAFQDACCKPDGKTTRAYSSFEAFPATGDPQYLYVALDTNFSYDWNPAATPPAYQQADALDAYCWPDPTTAIDVVVNETLPTTDYTCLTLPLCIGFASCYPEEYFAQRQGFFDVRYTDAPALCDATVEEYTSHQTYTTTGTGAVNLAVLKNCPTDWAYGHKISLQLKISADGVARNGGLILNYVQTQNPQTLSITTTYLAVQLDAIRGRIRVLRYTGSSFVEEAHTAVPVKTNTWYTLSATMILNGSNVDVQYAAEELSGANQVSGVATILNPGSLTGMVGLFSNQSLTFFNKFTVE